MNKGEEKRFVRRAVGVSCGAAVALTVLLLLLRAYWPEITMLRVSGLLSDGKADEALELMKTVDEEKLGDAAEAQRYRAALVLEAQGREDEAVALFDQLSGFANAAQRADGIRYARAEALLAGGDLEGAAQAFYLLGAYADAEARYAECMGVLHPTPAPTPAPTPTPSPAPTPAPTPTPSPTNAQAVAAVTASPSLSPTPTPIPTPAPTTEAEGLAAGRERARGNVLALGKAHTVGLRADGTAVATGLNAQGQCDVTGWTGLAQVAAGANHTLGLRADGTVLATGDNAYGQCEVSGWRNVKQIAAGAWDSFALLNDGTILSTGYHQYEAVGQWHGVRQIAAGSYGLVALYDGGCLSTHPSLRLKGFYADVSVSTGYAVGLKEDGTVEMSNGEGPRLRDVVDVSAGPNGLMALSADGGVWLRFFRGDAPSLPQIDGKVAAVQAGDTHYALLLSDGRVLCFGENDLGQCNTLDWSLGAPQT